MKKLDKQKVYHIANLTRFELDMIKLIEDNVYYLSYYEYLLFREQDKMWISADIDMVKKFGYRVEDLESIDEYLLQHKTIKKLTLQDKIKELYKELIKYD